MIEKDVIIFFDIDQTLNSSAIMNLSPYEPAVRMDFWNRINDFATIILLSKRPTILTWFFARRMIKAGWSIPDYLKGTSGFSKLGRIEEWLIEIKPKIAFFVGNTKKDCQSALANGCVTIRYTRHDKSILPDYLKDDVFSSDDPIKIEGFIEERLREMGLWMEEESEEETVNS
jgi:hypothetical protein